MPVFIKTLKNDKMDVEIVKVSLEALNILCTPDEETKVQSPKEKVLSCLYQLGYCGYFTRSKMHLHATRC